MHTTPLRTLIEPVPTCTQATSLATVLHVLHQEGAERLVVVDEQQHGLGLVRLANLLPYLDWPALARSRPASTSQSLEWQQPLAAIAFPLVTPLVSLSADWSLSQFFLYLQTLAQPERDWAVVDEDGQFLGLLSYSRVLQVLALDFPSSPPTTPRSLDFLPASPIDAEVRQAGRWILTTLLDVLDQLPLPFMLQTSSGQTVYQNQYWQEQFAQLGHLEDFHQTAAPLLSSETVPLPLKATSFDPSQSFKNRDRLLSSSFNLPTPASARPSFRANISDGNETAQPASSQPDQIRQGIALLSQQLLAQQTQTAHLASLTATQIYWPRDPSAQSSSEYSEDVLTSETAAIASSCRSGPTPDTYICTCRLQTDEEQVWQLTRLSLNLPTWEPPISTASAWLPASNSSPQPVQEPAAFRLANLTIDSQATGDRETTLQTLLQSSEQLWLVMAENCTEQQQITRALAAKNADLVQLNLLKDEFLACISHELKTPLTAVLGLSSLLKDQVLGNLNERQVRYAKLIYQSGRHLMAVVNDILDLTRMETGQLELSPGPVHLQPVCTRAIEQAYQQRFPDDSSATTHSLTGSEIPCSFTLEPGLETIIADEPRLRQMLVNLLSNALKFTDTGGEIKLSVNRWEGWIAFTVSDTGIGIAADKQHLIFQKFQQLENPLTRRFEGTGLGLVITQRLARLHGGDVTFFSREGQGSQFTLLLPPSPPQISFKDQPPHPLETQPNRLVLVVESVPLFIEEMSQQLSSLGYRVVIARSGPDALEKARRLQPCAVLLNPLLPLLSGWDILTLLKSDAETRHIPVIVTATNAEKEQAEKYQADRFLCLPIQSSTLQRCLAQVTDLLANNEQASASARLTILYLSSLEAAAQRSTRDKQPLSSDGLSYPGWAIANSLSHLLQLQHHRILEADDLEQAELLARVWHPDVILLDRAIPDPASYLQELTQYSFLVSLPLVTLTSAATEAANQISGLTVFPCLVSAGSATAMPINPEASALIQAIQVAVGLNWQASVLVVDLLDLPDLGATAIAPTFPIERTTPQATDWLPTLIQYLHSAGLKGLLARSWAEVTRQIHHQSVDLILICVRGNGQATTLSQVAIAIQSLNTQLPIVVLDQRAKHVSSQATERRSVQESEDMHRLMSQLQAIATQVLADSGSMDELLAQIHQALRQRPTHD